MTPPASAAETRGNLATRVVFKSDNSDNAVARLQLLASCHYSRVPSEGPLPSWDDVYSPAFNSRSHLYIRLAKPGAEKCADGVEMEVSEMLVLLP